MATIAFAKRMEKLSELPVNEHSLWDVLKTFEGGYSLARLSLECRRTGNKEGYLDHLGSL